jgi:hypothetical protein
LLPEAEESEQVVLRVVQRHIRHENARLDIEKACLLRMIPTTSGFSVRIEANTACSAGIAAPTKRHAVCEAYNSFVRYRCAAVADPKLGQLARIGRTRGCSVLKGYL